MEREITICSEFFSFFIVFSVLRYHHYQCLRNNIDRCMCHTEPSLLACTETDSVHLNSCNLDLVFCLEEALFTLLYFFVQWFFHESFKMKIFKAVQINISK